jgi:hypothetical protein
LSEDAKKRYWDKMTEHQKGFTFDLSKYSPRIPKITEFIFSDNSRHSFEIVDDKLIYADADRLYFYDLNNPYRLQRELSLNFPSESEYSITSFTEYGNYFVALASEKWLENDWVSVPTLVVIDGKGSVLEEISIPIKQASGICYDGEIFWITSSKEDGIFTFNIKTKTLTKRFKEFGLDAEGITWDGKSLWIADSSGVFFECDKNGRVLTCFYFPEKTRHQVLSDIEWYNGN